MLYILSFHQALVKKAIFAIFLIPGLFLSCVEKRDNNKAFPDNSFQIYVSESVEKKLYESQWIKYEVGPWVQFYHGNQKLRLDKLKVRGQSASDFRRKSFYVNTDGRLPIVSADFPDTLRFNKFVLSAMPMDFCYMNNRLAHLLMKSADLWPLHSFYIEFFINNKHQGLYLFIEEPKEYLVKEKEAQCIIRRGYDHHIDQIEDENGDEDSGLKVYAERFNSIYEVLPKLKGEELYYDLSTKLNLDNYFRKMAIDELVGNGDYTDEIFFYTTAGKKDEIRFDVMPWDYDDIFSPLPHEVLLKDSACGKCFGTRIYNTVEEYLNETKGRLVFSIEDDLDYIIMKDDFLYLKYLEKLDEVLQTVDEQLVISVFDQVKSELLPFYQIPEVIEQTKYDNQPTDSVIFAENFTDKKNKMVNRVTRLKEEVKKQRLQLAAGLK